MPATTQSKDGTTIAYDTVGSGPVVVLVHGATQFRSADAASTALAAAVAKQGFTAVTYDRRGRGGSTDTAPYALEREIEDLAAVIGATCGDDGSAVIWGSTSGGVLALWAVQAGLAISKLVLWEPPLATEDDGQDFLDTLRERVSAGDRDGAIAAFFGDVPEDWLDAVRQSPSYPAMHAVAHTLPYDAEIVARSLTGTPWELQWGEVRVPTLILVGKSSHPVLPAAGRRLGAKLPHGTFRAIESAHATVRPQQQASLLVAAMTPYERCAWSCVHCGTARQQENRAQDHERLSTLMDVSGPVPVWAEGLPGGSPR